MELNFINEEFDIHNVKNMNSLALAYIGDAVYEVFVRTHLIDKKMGAHVKILHKEATLYVKAKAQSNIIYKIMDELTEEESAVFKRGRNSKSKAPKNADVSDYKNATGFESLVGYLYLTKQNGRLNYFFQKIKDENLHKNIE